MPWKEREKDGPSLSCISEDTENMRLWAGAGIPHSGKDHFLFAKSSYSLSCLLCLPGAPGG